MGPPPLPPRLVDLTQERQDLASKREQKQKQAEVVCEQRMQCIDTIIYHYTIIIEISLLHHTCFLQHHPPDFSANKRTTQQLQHHPKDRTVILRIPRRENSASTAHRTPALKLLRIKRLSRSRNHSPQHRLSPSRRHPLLLLLLYRRRPLTRSMSRSRDCLAGG